ncbi:MAG: serine hydrolase [Pseudomonadota bacterium]
MHDWLRFGLVLFAALLAINAAARSDLTRFDPWPPDETRLSAAGVERIEAFLDQHGSSSFLIVFQGKLAYQYGDIHKKHLIHSIRKPLLSLLFGPAVAAGQIDLDQTVATLDLAETATPFTEQELNATVAELLQSRSGIYLPAAAETEQMAAARPPRGSHAPGEAYYYNNWSFNSLGSVFEQQTGQTIYDAFHQTLAQPLGMTRYMHHTGSFTRQGRNDEALILDGLDGFYLLEAEQSRHPAYHFRLSAHDLALIGQLLVNNGEWNGQQLIRSDWIERSTDCYSVINENLDGGRSLCYGMMWEVVRNANDETLSFMHTGLGRHMLYVYPSAQLLLVHRVDTEGDYTFPSGIVQQLIGLTIGALN